MPELPPGWHDNPTIAARILATLQQEKNRRAAALMPRWADIARPEQQPPKDVPWRVWMYMAGRGAGKTRSAAEWAIAQASSMKCRGALVGRTPADVRDVMIEGESGILACSRPDFMPVYEPTKRRLKWPNGSTAYAYSAEVPSQLRGPQHHWAWADEASSWTDAPKGNVVDTSWNNLMLGLRLPGMPSRCAVTTTPKNNKLTKAILKAAGTVLTKGTTYDNLANLSPEFQTDVLAAYEGTRIGRQELNGELLEDVEGALWSLQMIDGPRVDKAPDLRRVVVAVDPSGGDRDGNDEQGIVVAGVGVDGEFYVLADRSCKLSPAGWANRAAGAYHEYHADRIVAEGNFGGQMVKSTLQSVAPDVPVRIVTASRGKVQRAEPIAALYEQGRVHHVGALPKLEDQMTEWTPQDAGSPDRVDALVWALTDLSKTGQGIVYLDHMRRQLRTGDARESA